ncbi:Permease of the drug/metabolite transporter (DMT) superfamily [Roseomonas rosea]|uniref:Permease of the drug/metabolite transporter (DMT) superfamily n=1 Tax=Muricoccus roseus TaxID=198092 RepID=A0A1M6IQB9_9PROT|nr:DMT family transporter [Roseomonas rosea]SHJ36643.1 Permease of the drug/metabolite transporter (DMT) superfamily [Roseomonas rosea]
MSDHQTRGSAAKPLAPDSSAERPDEALRGIGLIALGFGIVTVSDAAVKWVLPEIGVAMAMILRGSLGALTVLVLSGGFRVRAVNRRLVVSRSLLHCAVTVTFYFAWFRGMPLADSYAVAAVAPLAMTVLAIPLLGETVGWRRWLSTVAGFLGVLVMVRPGGDLWRWEAAVLLGGVGFMAVTRIWTRVLARTDRPATVAFWLMVAHVPFGIAMLPFFPPVGWPSWGGVVAIILLGLGNGAAHLLFARAFALAPVGLLAPFEYSTLVTGTLVGVLVWGDVPAWTTLLGASIVVAAGLYNLYRAQKRAREAQALRQAAAREAR